MYIIIYKFRFEKTRYIGPFVLLDEVIRYIDRKGWKIKDSFSSCTIERLQL